MVRTRFKTTPSQVVTGSGSTHVTTVFSNDDVSLLEEEVSQSGGSSRVGRVNQGGKLSKNQLDCRNL